MDATALDFDPNGFPLDPGLRLLEASAGTGKTFALAHLALRLVTERAIPLRRLLVVTFTNAAATELRERIGRRLQEALLGLRDPHRPPPDPVLAEWLAGQRSAGAGGDGGSVAEMRLLLALEELDGADITTIHGFCQRTLQRQALEAQRPPDLLLDTDGDTLLEQVVHSYWQEQVLRLPTALLLGLSARKVTPETLTSLLRTLDGDPGLELDPLPASLPLDASLAEALPPLWQAGWQAFRNAWRERGNALMADLFSQAQAWKAEGLPYKPYTLKETKRWRAAAVEALVAEEDPGYAAVLQEEMLTTFLHPGTFCKTARALEDPGERAITLPQRALMEAVAAVVDGPADLALLHGAHWGRRALLQRRQRLGLCSYAQLLSDLDPGPDATAPTPLLTAVAERYSAALIDEFQDTDPIQWRILRLAFGGGGHLLVMVGDPKQAIYRFRGGDLETYLAARARADARFAMRDNRRSTPELIAALNQLCGRGLVRSGLTPLPALEAKASRGGDGQPPVDLLWLGSPWPPDPADTPSPSPAAERLPNSTALNARLPRQIASTVAQLLTDPPRLREGGHDRPLEAADICLLVNTHAQAEGLRLALRELGIPSRLVSQADVFATPAATALQRLLDALAEPADANRLRLLAASPLLGWSADAIASATPQRWSALAARLEQLARDWPRLGLLGPLAALVGAEQLARLSNGGRFLADLGQVAELTQQRLHRQRLGPRAVARWLRRRRRQPLDTLPEAEQTHSDKVRQAVAVMTVYRSKGLEFPLVICPYLWQDAGPGKGEGRRWTPVPGGPPRLDLHRHRHWGPGWEADRQARRELEAERERLAYVALSRAMHRLVLAWAPVKDRHCNPLQPWLFADDPVLAPEASWPETDLMAWRERLDGELRRRRLPVRLVEPPPPPPPGWRPPVGEPPPPAETLALGPRPPGPLDRGWARGSYSSWTHDRLASALPSGAPGSALALEDGRDIGDPDAEPDPVSAPSAAPAPPQPAPWPERGLWADLPAGSGFGDCLHRLLERLHFGTEPDVSAEPAACAEAVVCAEAAVSAKPAVSAEADDPRGLALAAHELRRAGLPDTLAEPLLTAVRQMLATPFGGPLGGLRPVDLPPRGRLHELHFDLSLQQARAADLAAAFRLHPEGLFGADYADALAELPVCQRGFLTGSIDLVFPTPGVEGGLWWVLDWKSNRLGRRDERGQVLSCGPGDYGPDALRQLMASHHYPLQAHLYLVALHRYLAWRLPNYDPRRHLGGYVYVFARGTPGPLPADRLEAPVPGMVIERPPLGRLLALDQALGTAPADWQPGTLP
ncbi:MAG: UvrD-helicase domain-containing protein [Cyanobacteriota bacterium]|nr:UvrD-helicase domain-containing protein [Cyanobacteriota bacterium]